MFLKCWPKTKKQTQSKKKKKLPVSKPTHTAEAAAAHRRGQHTFLPPFPSMCCCSPSNDNNNNNVVVFLTRLPPVPFWLLLNTLYLGHINAAPTVTYALLLLLPLCCCCCCCVVCCCCSCCCCRCCVAVVYFTCSLVVIWQRPLFSVQHEGPLVSGVDDDDDDEVLGDLGLLLRKLCGRSRGAWAERQGSPCCLQSKLKLCSLCIGILH